MRAKGSVDFSFNWTRWPFVEVGEPSSSNLKDQLEPNLISDLQDWCDFMLSNFDERAGFSSSQARARANKEYELLCRRLEASNIVFNPDNWWS